MFWKSAHAYQYEYLAIVFVAHTDVPALGLCRLLLLFLLLGAPAVFDVV